jgi:hypothetical protein
MVWFLIKYDESVQTKQQDGLRQCCNEGGLSGSGVATVFAVLGAMWWWRWKSSWCRSIVTRLIFFGSRRIWYDFYGRLMEGVSAIRYLYYFVGIVCMTAYLLHKSHLLQTAYLWLEFSLAFYDNTSMKMLKFHQYGINFSARSILVKTYVLWKHVKKYITEHSFNARDFVQISLNFIVLLCAVSPTTWILWWILRDGIFHHMGFVAYRAHRSTIHITYE